MQDASPVLDVNAQLLESCCEITRDKIDLITKAMAAHGRITRKTANTGWHYDPLADALFKLASNLRRITKGNFNATEWREVITFADNMWWEWYDRYPLPTADSTWNYTPYISDQLALREKLKAKYETAAAAQERAEVVG